MASEEHLLQELEPAAQNYGKEARMQEAEPETTLTTSLDLSWAIVLWSWIVLLLEYCFVALTVLVDQAKAFALVFQAAFFCVSLLVQGIFYRRLRQEWENSESPASRKFYKKMEEAATHVFDVIPVQGERLGLKRWLASLVSFSLNFISALSSAAYLSVVREHWKQTPDAQRLFSERWAFVPFIGHRIGEYSIVLLYVYLLAWCGFVHIATCSWRTFHFVKHSLRQRPDFMEDQLPHLLEAANLLFLGQMARGRLHACEVDFARWTVDRSAIENHATRDTIAFATKAILLWVKLSLTGIIFNHFKSISDILLTCQAICLAFLSVLPRWFSMMQHSVAIFKSTSTTSRWIVFVFFPATLIVCILISHLAGLLLCESHDLSLLRLGCTVDSDD